MIFAPIRKIMSLLLVVFLLVSAASTAVWAVEATDPTDVPDSTVSPTAVPTHPPYSDVPIRYDTIKVGLNFGSSAVTEAVLTNEIGSGFRFGYFDQNREFHEIGNTSATSITLIPDWNWTTAAGIAFGCYHIVQTGSFTNFDDAKAEADRIGGFPTYYSGSYFVLYGNYWTPEDGETAKLSMNLSGEVQSQSSRCVVVTETGTNRILFEFDCGSASSLAIQPISDTEKAITQYNNSRYHGDFQFARLTGREFMTVVNYVDIEDYTKGVVPYEMYASWPFEALKAQALCARNYAVTNFNRYRAQGFDVSCDVYSQVYHGIGDTNDATNRAVDATAGQYIRYQGDLCQTFFFSSDGGATESSENVWGCPIPYLIGVEDPYEEDVNTYSENWRYTLTPEQVQERLNGRTGANLEPIEQIDCEFSEQGNIKKILFKDQNGKTHSVSGNRCVLVMGAKSPRFQVETDEDGNFLVEGSGWGHNCGMSQYGAYSMAEHHGKTADEIIKFYYTGVYIR